MDRKTGRKKDRWTDGQTGRKTDKQADGWVYWQTDRPTDWLSDRLSVCLTVWLAGSQPDTQRNDRKDRQIDRGMVG
jgi:hypothetical protein